MSNTEPNETPSRSSSNDLAPIPDAPSPESSDQEHNAGHLGTRRSSNLRRTRRFAFVFELGLALLALLLGWLLGSTPWRTLINNSPQEWMIQIGWGLLGVLPMLAMLAVVELAPWHQLVSFRQQVRRILLTIFADASWVELALLSLAAGIGEEFLFRGALQDGLQNIWGQPASAGWALAAWLIASVVFGVCHWVNRTYALLAMLAGLYLGAMFWLLDHLAAPIITHAVYDFLALAYLLKWRRVET